jgi:hypothetical protein
MTKAEWLDECHALLDTVEMELRRLQRLHAVPLSAAQRQKALDLAMDYRRLTDKMLMLIEDRTR